MAISRRGELSEAKLFKQDAWHGKKESNDY
jgi:hypothetical protein